MYFLVNSIHDKGDFAEVIKLRILRWEDYPGLSRWVQCSPKVSHEGRRGRRVRVKRER